MVCNPMSPYAIRFLPQAGPLQRFRRRTVGSRWQCNRHSIIPRRLYRTGYLLAQPALVLFLVHCVISVSAAQCIHHQTVCKPHPLPVAVDQVAGAAGAMAASTQQQQQPVAMRQLTFDGPDADAAVDLTVANVLLAVEAKNSILELQSGTGPQHAMFWSGDPQQQLTQITDGPSNAGRGEMQSVAHTFPTIGRAWDEAAQSLPDAERLDDETTRRRRLLAAQGVEVLGTQFLSATTKTPSSATTAVRTSPTWVPPPAPAPASIMVIKPQPLVHIAPPARPPLPGPTLQPSQPPGKAVATGKSKARPGHAAPGVAPAVTGSHRKRRRPAAAAKVLVSPKVTLYGATSPLPVGSPVPEHLGSLNTSARAANSAASPVASWSVSAPTGPATTHIVAPSAHAPAPAAPPAVAATAKGSISNVPGKVRHSPDGVVFVSHSRIIIGIDPTHGGAIMYLSSPALPASLADLNLVNIWDAGRLIQQSYYGCYDGSCWFDKVWRWNPVQGGSWQHQLPRIVHRHIDTSSGTVRVAANPRNWAGQELLEDVHMMTELTLWEHGAKVRFTMRYTGNSSHPSYHQEVPAVYVTRRLGVLATYTGKRPWSNDTLSFIEPGEKGQYYKPTEQWAAYLDSRTGYGVGVYSPVSTQLVGYRIGPDGSGAKQHCSYFAPIITAQVKPQTEISYDVYLAVGHINDLRHWFGQVADAVDHSRIQVQRKILSVSLGH